MKKEEKLMAKKKYYDEDGRQVRSRTSKPFYKKWPIWIIIFFSTIFGAIGIYTSGGDKNTEDEPIEKIEKETANKEKEKEVSVKKEESEEEKENIKEQTETYTYEDFKGTYIEFEGEPYKSPIGEGMAHIVVLGDESYQTFNRWDYNLTSPILDKTIVGNLLTLNLDSYEDQVWGRHSKSGTEKFELRQVGNMKILHFITEERTLYSISQEDLQMHYAQSEIDYARIIMTLMGVPSLDMWAGFSSEYNGDKPIVAINHNKKGDVILYTTNEGNVKYPEDVTTLYLKNKARRNEISYTYASIKDGYIRVYPVPINYALKTGEEVIDGAEQHYIKPFEPFEVADFIGHVEFEEE